MDVTKIFAEGHDDSSVTEFTVGTSCSASADCMEIHNETGILVVLHSPLVARPIVHTE